MRGFDCEAPDGSHKDKTHFEGKDNDEIVRQATEHVAKYHAALGLGPDQIRAMVVQGSYDIPAR
jgi:hypothetical protein